MTSDPRIQGFLDGLSIVTGLSIHELEKLIEIRRCAPPLYPEGEVSAAQRSVDNSPMAGELGAPAETVRRTAGAS